MESTQYIRVLFVDDHPLMREGLRHLFETESDIQLEADLSSGEEAYAWYRAHRPDVVIMDLAMDGIGGLEATRRIIAWDPDACILVFTVSASDVILAKVLDVGAIGFVTKASPLKSLIQAVKKVASHQIYVSSDMMQALAQLRRQNHGTQLDSLSPREFEIFRLLADGKPVSEIAQILSLSSKTVSNHYTRIKHKLDVPGTGGMIRLAIRHGIIEP